MIGAHRGLAGGGDLAQQPVVNFVEVDAYQLPAEAVAGYPAVRDGAANRSRVNTAVGGGLDDGREPSAVADGRQPLRSRISARDARVALS